MRFSERPCSTQWAPLKYRGENFAEVWFKPDGEPCSLLFRIRKEGFSLPGMDQLLTLENLLKAVGVTTEEVASWRIEGSSLDGTSLAASEAGQPLPLPVEGASHLQIHVRLEPTSPADAADDSGTAAIPEARWQDLESRWNAILGLEASIDTVRISMETLRAEMEAASSRSLTAEEKLNALNADVLQWTKAKSRLHHAIPKVREYIHRSTWAAGTPERKRLEELITNYIRPRIPFPEIHQMMDQLENLLKDRQILSAQGVAVYQECKAVANDVQGALRTLQSSARSNAIKKRGTDAARGKSF